MGTLFSLLGVARDGMAAQTAGLDVTGQNVSNVNTPGYVRRGAVLETRALGPDGTVDFVGIQRAFDRFANARVVAEGGKHQAADARSSVLGQVEAIVAPQTGNIGDSVSALMSAFNSLTAYPMDTSARATVLAKATAVAQAFSSTASGLNSMQGALLQKAQGVAGEVNERLAKIANLNTQIAQAVARGDSAADLRDLRDKVVGEVGDRIGAKAIEDKAGNVTLFALGSALVDGNTASSIDVSLDANGALKVTVQRPGGTNLDVSAYAQQGSLGGIREARDVDIAAISTQLDQFAFDFSQAINGAHQSGFGLDGVTGRPLFQPAGAVKNAAYLMALDPAMVGQPDRVAAAQAAADVPGGNDVALKLFQIASNPLGAGGTPAERFGAIAGDVGVRKTAADSELKLREDTLAQVKQLNESASGVSVDEEMVNLTKFQRAFEASTRVLKTVDELLSNLIRDL